MTLPELWTEKYRPTSLDDYVFTDDKFKIQVTQWIETKNFPHMILTGSPGVGKTAIAYLIVRLSGVDEADVMYVNASHHTGVDHARDKVRMFASGMPFGESPYRVVILDEADAMSLQAQMVYRKYLEDLPARFIFLGNNDNRIMDALKSRCVHKMITKLPIEEYYQRILNILKQEDIPLGENNVQTLSLMVDACYPDMRRLINMVQGSLNVETKTLMPPSSEGTSGPSDNLLTILDMFNRGNFSRLRDTIAERIPPEGYVEVYKALYKSIVSGVGQLDEYFQRKAIVIIAKYLATHTISADTEINLAAMICELEEIVLENMKSKVA